MRLMLYISDMILKYTFLMLLFDLVFFLVIMKTGHTVDLFRVIEWMGKERI